MMDARWEGHMRRLSRGHVAGVLGVLFILGVVACSPAAQVAAPSRPAESGQRAPAPAAEPAQQRLEAKSSDAAQSTAPWDRMVIRTVNLGLQVENVERAIAQVREIAQAGGGFVSASNSRLERVNEQERMVADLTIQVRGDALDSTVQALRQMAIKVESETGSSQDVTEEYVDLDSQLRNFQATEAAVLKLMERTERIEDVLALQRELSNVRGNIERIQGRKRFLERRTEMATITLALRLPPVQDPQAPLVRGWEPVRAAQRGWVASLVVLRGVTEVLIVAAAFSWWLVPFLALGAYTANAWNGRRIARRAPQPPAPQA
jgi:hypothetical protein